MMVENSGNNKINNLEIGTPYMLRNDGVLLECNAIHPSFLSFLGKDLQRHIDKEFDYTIVEWFINNTRNKVTLDKLNQLKHCKGMSIGEVEQLLKDLSRLTNQEFCRVRMSNIRLFGKTRDIYFRISSTNFNWHNYIWNVVYKYRDQIESVTICSEEDICEPEHIYYLSDGTPIDKLPTKQFIMAEGKITLLPRLNLLNKLRQI